MKDKKKYENWLNKNIEGWNKADDKDTIKVIFVSGKYELLDIDSMSNTNLKRFTKEELIAGLLNKKYS